MSLAQLPCAITHHSKHGRKRFQDSNRSSLPSSSKLFISAQVQHPLKRPPLQQVLAALRRGPRRKWFTQAVQRKQSGVIDRRVRVGQVGVWIIRRGDCGGWVVIFAYTYDYSKIWVSRRGSRRSQDNLPSFTSSFRASAARLRLATVVILIMRIMTLLVGIMNPHLINVIPIR